MGKESLRCIKISEKELAIKEYKRALALRNQYSLTTTTNNNNSVWKTVGLIFFGIIGLGCLTGIAYLIGQQNSAKNNRCKY